MATYTVYFCEERGYRFCSFEAGEKRPATLYEKIGTVEANNLDEAYAKLQGWREYRTLEGGKEGYQVRSLSVGDILWEEGSNFGFAVDNVGWSAIKVEVRMPEMEVYFERIPA